MSRNHSQITIPDQVTIQPIISEYLDLSRQYLAILDLMSEKELNSVPLRGGWTAAQVIQHIGKANHSGFLSAPGKPADRDIGEQIPLLEKEFMNFEVKMTSPDFLVPENREFSKQETVHLIQDAFKSLVERLPESDLALLIDTPLGKVTKWELANFIVFHSKRHLHQLRNIRNKLNQIEIAMAFSHGTFQQTYPYLAADIVWTVVGENEMNGIEAVIKNCEEVSAYFQSVSTIFKTLNVIADENKVAITGTGEFFREGKRISFVSACDVYEFNDQGKLLKITSYCIQKPKINP